MRALRRLLRCQDGSSIVEFGLIAPILCGVLLLCFDGWRQVNQIMDMRTAVQTGARYYQVGGSDDAAAQTTALAAWSHKPSDGALDIARACTCGTTAIACGVTCTSDKPMTYVTVSASSTFSGVFASRPLNEKEVLRVR